MSDETFMGLPIKGDKTESYKSEVEQWPIEQFADALKTLFTFDEIEAIKWTQYTPYFNDGEPCIFGIRGELEIKVKGSTDEDDDASEGFLSLYSKTLENIIGSHTWEGTWPDTKKVYTNSPNLPLTLAIDAFSDALDRGHYEDALQKLFGDHAEITATREGFEIEFYEHD